MTFSSPRLGTGAGSSTALPAPGLIDFLPEDMNSAQELHLLQVFLPLAGGECSWQLLSVQDQGAVWI